MCITSAVCYYWNLSQENDRVFFFCVLVKWWKVLSFAMSYQSSVIPLSDSVAECHFSLSYRYYGK